MNKYSRMEEIIESNVEEIIEFKKIIYRGKKCSILYKCEFKIDIGNFKKGERVDTLILILDYNEGRLIQLHDEDGEVIKSAKLKITEDKA
jgi:hypothetical protein